MRNEKPSITVNAGDTAVYEVVVRQQRYRYADATVISHGIYETDGGMQRQRVVVASVG